MSSIEKLNYRGPVLRVAVPSPLRRLFDYLPPTAGDKISSQIEIPAGIRVKVPFGNRHVIGMLVEVVSGSSLSKNKLKPVIALLDEKPLFTPSLFRLLLWGASYYHHPLGEVFATAMPGKLRTGSKLKRDRAVWTLKKALADEEMQSLGRAFKQKALLEFIATQGQATARQCLDAGFAQSLLTQLSEKNLIRSKSVPEPTPEPFKAALLASSSTIVLNDEQKRAVSTISKKLHTYACFLLDGVTGSGKTEVYMQLMYSQLSQGRQCLVLVPEIGLTPQTIARFKERFDCPVVSLHSGLNESERLDAWNQARDGSAGIIIGTRSAVFIPLAKPGLIIVDEEHDSSFKQQDGFRYSARDLAVMRAREENICVLLGSATPSLESLHNAHCKKFTHLKLINRTGAAQATSTQVVDISEETLQDGFSEQLLYKIQKHLDQGNQILVFINRRGFAPILNCQSCGWISECEHCISQFTVHANPPSLRCHHCGTIRALPRHCPLCKSRDLNTIGIGTQKIESFLKQKFSTTPVLRIDRDSTRRKASLEKMLEQVHQGDPCILLGTQMLAKGHHFPNITLVAILDADAGLFSADFRGQEHMAQTIVQVAGRAGRAERAGEVLIQSRHSTHATLQCLGSNFSTSNPYAEFAEKQLAERKKTAMPPYSHLCLLRAEAPELQVTISTLNKIAAIVDDLCSHSHLPVERLGPLPAPMEKRAGRFRAQLLLKSESRGALQELLRQLCQQLEGMKTARSLRLSIDVDPQDLI